MIPKFLYLLIFLALTALHICAHLQPTIEAHASLKTSNLQFTRKLNLNVGYEYHHSLLWQAVMNTVLVVYGFWRCEREVDNEKMRYYQSLNTIDKDPKSGGTQKISAANKVKLNWMLRRSKLPSSWQLFPLRIFSWFTLPWVSTYLLNELCNYAQLNLVMRHFCTSPLEVFVLYIRVQLLYLHHVLSSIVPYLLQFNGAFESLTAAHTNCISYESDMLVGDE